MVRIDERMQRKVLAEIANKVMKVLEVREIKSFSVKDKVFYGETDYPAQVVYADTGSWWRNTLNSIYGKDRFLNIHIMYFLDSGYVLFAEIGDAVYDQVGEVLKEIISDIEYIYGIDLFLRPKKCA